jgi:hypothetical protein
VKLNIAGTEYDYQAALQKIGIRHLVDLKEQSGFGKRTVHEALDLLSDGLKAEEGETPEQQARRAADVQDDPVVLRGIAGLAFIAKRYAGEDVAFDDVAGLALGDIQFVPEASDYGTVEPDPTMALAAEVVQGASVEPRKNARTAPAKKSKTSKPRSTAASS